MTTIGVRRANIEGTADHSRVYFGMDIGDSWNNPCKVATREAMEAYRAEQIAAWNS